MPLAFACSDLQNIARLVHQYKTIKEAEIHEQKQPFITCVSMTIQVDAVPLTLNSGCSFLEKTGT